MTVRSTATGDRRRVAAGYAFGALLVSLAVAGILLSVALPVWTQAARREREAELVFRGEQYARAVQLYQRIYAGAFPSDVETLLDERFLRSRYADPMTPDGEFRVLHESEVDGLEAAAPTAERPGELAETPPATTERPVVAEEAGGSERPRGGVVGVVSRSRDDSLRVYNGATRYDQWLFLAGQAADAPGEASGSSP